MLASPTAQLWQVTTNNKQTIYAHPSLPEVVTNDWFEPKFWYEKQSVTGESSGRNTTYFIQYSDSNETHRDFVLRHYYRGGLVSRLLNDEFLYTGLEKTRSIAELTMLQKMKDLGLPVPQPVAAMVTRVSSLWCRNDILIERINDAKDGYHWLIEQELQAQTWQAIGATIKQFHQQGVYHSDLNIHNIMIDKSGNVYLIDFDSCEFRSHSTTWKNNNLSRLLRSLVKEKNNAVNQDGKGTFHFSQQNWHQLLMGYEQ